MDYRTVKLVDDGQATLTGTGNMTVLTGGGFNNAVRRAYANGATATASATWRAALDRRDEVPGPRVHPLDHRDRHRDVQGVPLRRVHERVRESGQLFEQVGLARNLHVHGHEQPTTYTSATQRQPAAPRQLPSTPRSSFPPASRAELPRARDYRERTTGFEPATPTLAIFADPLRAYTIRSSGRHDRPKILVTQGIVAGQLRSYCATIEF